MVHSYILKGNTNRPSKFVETLNYMPNTFCIIRNGSTTFLSKFYMITTFIGMLANNIYYKSSNKFKWSLLLTCFYRWQKMYQAPISFQQNRPTMSGLCLLQGWRKVVHPSNIDLSTLWLYNPKIKKNISYMRAGC